MPTALFTRRSSAPSPTRVRPKPTAGPAPSSGATGTASGLPLYLQHRSRARPGERATEHATEHRADQARARDAAKPRSESAYGTRELAGERTPATSATSQWTGEAGRPLNPDTRARAESAFDRSFADVRVHDNDEARFTTGALGARALADGSNLWLGPGESEADWPLLSHELAHVDRGDAGIHLRSATWLERRAWLAFFDHYLPRKFLNNYMDDTGNAITLTEQEMKDVNPRVDLRQSEDFRTELAALQKQSAAWGSATGTPIPAPKYITVSGPGQAMTNGTLGNFTIRYEGLLQASADGTWSFVGTMTFYDFWDFDPKPFGSSGRSTAGELKTRVAATGLPGSPFHIYSERAVLSQSGGDPRATWSGGKPQFVNDRAGRAGSDVAGGTEVAGPGGPDAEAAGGEAGAQSAEDLNP